MKRLALITETTTELSDGYDVWTAPGLNSFNYSGSIRAQTMHQIRSHLPENSASTLARLYE